MARNNGGDDLSNSDSDGNCDDDDDNNKCGIIKMILSMMVLVLNGVNGWCDCDDNDTALIFVH